MKKFEANQNTETLIVLTSEEQLESFFETITTEDQLILTWKEKEHTLSEVIITSNVSAKIINGDIRVMAKTLD